MSKQRTRPLKLENTVTGGGMDDSFPTAMNPAQDYADIKGVVFEGSDSQAIDVDGSGNMTFEDTVTGVKTLADLSAAAASPVALIIALG